MDLRVLRVVVASPGDVKPERDLVSKVVEEVNRTIARERGLHLDLYRWETDSHPGFHPQGPQGLIDPQLKIEDCDLLIGIFWRRFGTPVSDAKSGTEHEFRLAYKAWKKKHKPQIMVYFSQKAYTPKSKEETDQWGLVLQFKKDFPKEGLWWEYQNKFEFERLLRNHLTQFLQEQSPIERKSEKKQSEASPLTPLFQLPPPPADFTGRAAELAELRTAIEKGGVHISGLQGQGGVGKTALALKLAAELAPNYPDAQIYLDLKGVSEKPLTAAEAMSHVLRTFHPEAKLPEKEEDLRALYLSVLHDKRALLLMDNAKDAAQVKPLIPPPGCALLVTSRQHFALPGLQAKNLETLPPLDAKDLLLRIAPRIDGEVEAIAKLCGYLPQALRLAASAISVHLNLEPSDYAKQLADEKKRLELLAGDDESITASITLSYNLLDAETQTRWRILAVFPDTFDAPAAATVWEMEDDPAKEELSRFLQFSMLEWNRATRRYRLHDLMRAFGRERSTTSESSASARRHALHYLGVVAIANESYRKGGEDRIVRGLALFDLEWENIQAGQAWAATHALEDREATQLCTGYSDWSASILPLRRSPRDEILWHESALAAARRLKDPEAEGRQLCNLGVAYRKLGDYRLAIEHHGQHLAIARGRGDHQGEGSALGNLGNTHLLLGDYSLSIDYLEKAQTILHEIGDLRGAGAALCSLGLAHSDLGDGRDTENYDKAVGIFTEIGDLRGAAFVLGNLGIALYGRGDHTRALEYYEKAAGTSRAIRDWQGEATSLWNMSLTLDKLGRRDEAVGCAEAALKIKEQIEDPNTAMIRQQLDIWKNG